MQENVLPQKEGKYQRKMIKLCDHWPYTTKVIIVCNSFFREPFSIFHCISFLKPTTHKAYGLVMVKTARVKLALHRSQKFNSRNTFSIQNSRMALFQ